MKKYLLGIFALMMAVGFSAFTPQKKIANNTPQPYLIWYTIDSDGSLGVAYDGTNEYTKNEVLPLIVCDETDDPDCMRGYEDEQFDFVSQAPAVSGVDEHIRKKSEQ